MTCALKSKSYVVCGLSTFLSFLSILPVQQCPLRDSSAMHLFFLVLPQNKIFSSMFKLSSALASAAVVTYRQNSQCWGLNFHRENNCACNSLSISFSFLIRLITNFTTTSILAQETRHSTKTKTLPCLLCLILGKFYPPSESEQKEVREFAFTRCRTSFYPYKFTTCTLS